MSKKEKSQEEIFKIPKVTKKESEKYSDSVKLPKKYVSDRLPYSKVKKMLDKSSK